MKIKTSELTGRVLDWAVAVADGRVIHGGDWYGPFDERATLKWSCTRSGSLDALCHLSGGVYCPSAIWAQGGPIIERERISVIPFDDRWEARCGASVQRTPARFIERRGPTPLIAAMRCFVASKLGNEVDVPKELV